MPAKDLNPQAPTKEEVDRQPDPRGGNDQPSSQKDITTEDPSDDNDGEFATQTSAAPIAGAVDPILPAPPVVKVMSIENFKKAFNNFLQLTGFKATDVDGYSMDRLTFTTKAGGKYRLSRNGKNVQRLAGPLTPVELKAAG